MPVVSLSTRHFNTPVAASFATPGAASATGAAPAATVRQSSATSPATAATTGAALTATAGGSSGPAGYGTSPYGTGPYGDPPVFTMATAQLAQATGDAPDPTISQVAAASPPTGVHVITHRTARRGTRAQLVVAAPVLV